jgi:hypothetical protein
MLKKSSSVLKRIDNIDKKDRYYEMPIFFLAMILGFASWILPDLIISGTEPAQLPIRFIIDTPIMTNHQISSNLRLICLVLTGITMGFLFPKYWLSSGLATMLLVLVFSLIDAALMGGHNLLGIEMFVYAFFSLPGLIGSFIGRFISNMFQKKGTAY